MQRFIGGVSFVLATLALASPATAQTKLQFKFQKGDQFSYALETRNRMVTSSGGKDVESEVVQELELKWSVSAVETNGAAQTTVKFARVKVVLSGPMGKVELDSQSDKAPDDTLKGLHEAVKALTKVEMTCTVQPTGDITNAKVNAEALKQVKGVQGAEALTEGFSEEALKRMVLGGVVLPKEEVSKDKEWTQKVDMKVPLGQIAGQVRFVYEGVAEKDGQKLHRIGIHPELILKAKPNPMAEVKTKGPEGKGYALFDAATGRLVELSGTQTVELSADVNNVMITQQMNVTSTMRLKK